MIAIAVALLLAACAPMSPPVERLGADDLIARLDLDPTERPLNHLDVALSRAASVVVLYVVPGRGAAVIYPASDEIGAPMAAGPHRIALTTPATTRALRRATALGPLGELVLVATENSLDGTAVRSRLARVSISGDAHQAVADAMHAVLAASPTVAWSAVTTRTWLLPSDARTRGLVRMPRAQRDADIF